MFDAGMIGAIGFVQRRMLGDVEVQACWVAEHDPGCQHTN
jgi:hypothetical protein